MIFFTRIILKQSCIKLEKLHLFASFFQNTDHKQSVFFLTDGFGRFAGRWIILFVMKSQFLTLNQKGRFIKNQP